MTMTVGGTNGKGSCVAYLEAIYRNQGYRVGAYTSPHILKYNERIKVDGEPVGDEPICRAFERIEQVRGNISLSYFEFGTLAALLLFRQTQVDVQLLEVGLGGRLDAVNIVEPDAVIISSIGIDHVAWLGETREMIGFEKAGIFRRDVPAVVGDPIRQPHCSRLPRTKVPGYFPSARILIIKGRPDLGDGSRNTALSRLCPILLCKGSTSIVMRPQ